jgi:hypothetical protein
MRYKIGDSKELARIWGLPESWIRSQTRGRKSHEQQIPHLRLGKYVRFELDSPQLEEWLNRHRSESH